MNYATERAYLHAWQARDTDPKRVPLVLCEPKVLIDRSGDDAVAGTAAAGAGRDTAAHRLDLNSLRLLL